MEQKLILEEGYVGLAVEVELTGGRSGDRKRLTLIKVKQRVGAATLLEYHHHSKNSELGTAKTKTLHLIHILAKHETPMKARRTLLGRVPAKLKTRVMITRSMLVLLNADEMVKPPISNIMVGENMIEKTNLDTGNV